MIPELNRLMALFEGYPDAHGTYRVDSTGVSGEKQTGKATTVRNPVTSKLWEYHLRGMIGLGIIPINAESNVKFGAIDIDVYENFSHAELIQKIEKWKMPLIVCRTKSGGAHCYIFLKEFTAAKLVQSKLREMAGLLGYGTSEIFPKQVEILTERGDIGQWINMPYQNLNETTRFAYSADAKPMSISEFVDIATNMRVDMHTLAKWNTKEVIVEALPGGPPCLQILCSQGFPKGTRNNGLFNLGVYAMKSHKDSWESKLVELNQKHMDPPLDPTEVMGVIKALKKKEYNYMCDQAPIQQYCNAGKCRTCKFGVGNGMGLPVMGTLTKLQTKPPIWFIDVDGGKRIELATDQLQDPRKFQLVCMDHLNMMPAIPKKADWDALVQKMMENVSVIEVSKDMSPEGQLIEVIERFCTGRAQAQRQDEILLGKPWTNNDRHYFRVSDIVAYLDRNRFKYDGTRWLCKTLQSIGGKHDFFNIKGKGVNVWSVPEFKTVDEKLQTPDQKQDTPFA